MTQRGLPWDAKTSEEVYEHFATQLGMTHPLMRGIWGDEFLPMSEEKDGRVYPLFTEAVRKLRASPQFQGRRLYAYTTSALSPAMRPFIEAVVQSDYRLAREGYGVDRAREEDLAG